MGTSSLGAAEWGRGLAWGRGVDCTFHYTSRSCHLCSGKGHKCLIYDLISGAWFTFAFTGSEKKMFASKSFVRFGIKDMWNCPRIPLRFKGESSIKIKILQLLTWGVDILFKTLWLLLTLLCKAKPAQSNAFPGSSDKDNPRSCCVAEAPRKHRAQADSGLGVGSGGWFFQGFWQSERWEQHLLQTPVIYIFALDEHGEGFSLNRCSLYLESCLRVIMRSYTHTQPNLAFFLFDMSVEVFWVPGHSEDEKARKWSKQMLEMMIA